MSDSESTEFEDQDLGDPRRYDPDFQGPTTKRSSTDVMCCMIFVLFIMGYILLGLLAWVHGDPRKMAYPTDSQGQFCGQKGTPNENKTVLFYFNIFRCTGTSMMLRLQCSTTQICVSRCPERFLTYVDMQILNKEDKNYWEYYRQFCKAQARPVETLADLLSSGDCPLAVYPSRPFLQRCVPDFSAINGNLTLGSRMHFEDGGGQKRTVVELREAASGISDVIDARAIGLKVLEDYSTSWKWILIGLTIAMALSWTFLVLLRFTAGFLFWFFIFGVLGIIGYGIWYCFLEYNSIQQKPQSAIWMYGIGIQTRLNMFFHLKETWFSMMIILSAIEVVIIIVLIFLRTRIQVAIILLKEGSKAIGYLPSALVYPFLTFILLSICISYWAVTAVFLATSGVPIFKVMVPEGECIHEDEACDPEIFPNTDIPKACPGASCNFAFYGGRSMYHNYIATFQLYNLFAFLWLINFVIALGQCALAGAFASYYWAMRKPEDIPRYPLFTAFGRAVRYHTGSLAFGSLILAFVQMFKVIVEYLDRRLKKAQNSAAQFLHCCLRCCFWCLEKMVKFLNRNAYIMIALYGKNFCESTRDAFYLLMRNILKVKVTDEVTYFVLLLGKVLVSGIVGVLAFLLFTERLHEIVEGPTSLNYYWVPFLTLVFGSYLIAHGFFSVYSMCVETIFICFSLGRLKQEDFGSEARLG
uniref:Choline transporter-like protein n=1 Tax=Rattus norvegicus TaxID=10116 RepID=A0A0G2JX63_RAT